MLPLALPNSGELDGCVLTLVNFDKSLLRSIDISILCWNDCTISSFLGAGLQRLDSIINPEEHRIILGNAIYSEVFTNALNRLHS